MIATYFLVLHLLSGSTVTIIDFKSLDECQAEATRLVAWNDGSTAECAAGMPK